MEIKLASEAAAQKPFSSSLNLCNVKQQKIEWENRRAVAKGRENASFGIINDGKSSSFHSVSKFHLKWDSHVHL